MISATDPFRDVQLAARDVVKTPAPDGTFYVRSTLALGSYPARMTDRLDDWAARAPERTFLARRDARGEWRRVTWAEARWAARNIGQALVDRGLGQERQVVILSGNDLEHALLGLGAMYAGVPYAP